MSRKILKWAGIGLGIIVVLILIVSILFVIISNRKSNVNYSFTTPNLTIPSDAASIAEGERLVAIRGCGDCHGNQLEGKLFIEDAAFGTFYASNLTGGQNSVTADYTPADWDRAIRHGVNQDGKSIWIMPSTDYYRIADSDLVQMIAYLESLTPTDLADPLPEPQPGPILVALLATGQFEHAAAIIDHDTPAPATVTADISVEYGDYLATTCTGCHQPDFSGGPMLGAAPDDPPAANLTPAGHLANWTEAEFINTLRTGTTPEGKILNPEYMPWPITLRMTDDELAALWLYLSSLPAVETDS